jgi:1-acyl-sn-glycerol-3-phosphate acyltransferase
MTWRAAFAGQVLRWFDWRVVSAPPPAQHGVVIIYPHTSNWDFIIGVLARPVMNLRMHWVGKHTLFRAPFGGLMRALGGIAVDRSQAHGLVAQLQKEYARYAQFFIVITPEGTRKRVGHWKSGFYHIAHGLKVPLGLACIDYRRREVGVMQWLWLTGDIERDLTTIRAAYADCRGKQPELAGEIRFKDN